MTSFHNSLAETGERKFIKIESKTYKSQRFDFQSYELAFAVRETVYHKIIAFDNNNDQQFQENEIRDFLQHVLHQSQTEIKYVIRNVFRYDYNNDGVIEYDQLVNFCMEQHFGQLAIQRLHKKKLYKKGSQRVMNEQEFNETIRYALSFIEFNPSDHDLKIAFQTIDSDKDGEISYEDYFRFLKEYFGTKSYAAGLVNKKSILEEIHNSREKKGELNIVKKYSKYQNLIPNQNSNKLPQTNVPKILQFNNQKLPQSQPNIAQNSNSMGGSNTTKKNSKIELTIANKNKQPRSQITLTSGQQTIASKIARLVYTQLVVLLTQYDSDRDCLLSPEDIILYLKASFKYSEHQALDIYRKHSLVKNKLVSYSQAAKIVMNEHISNTFRTHQHESNNNVQLSQFCQLFEKLCSIVKNTPIFQKFESLYLSRTEKAAMSMTDAQNLSSVVFDSYNKR